MDVKRIGAWVLLAVGLMLATGACDQADEIGGQVQDTVRQGLDSAREALSEADDAISGATRATSSRSARASKSCRRT